MGQFLFVKKVWRMRVAAGPTLPTPESPKGGGKPCLKEWPPGLMMRTEGHAAKHCQVF